MINEYGMTNAGKEVSTSLRLVPSCIYTDLPLQVTFFVFFGSAAVHLSVAINKKLALSK